MKILAVLLVPLTLMFAALTWEDDFSRTEQWLMAKYGRVSLDEYGSFLGLFASIDSNGGGVLSRYEIDVDLPLEATVTRWLLWLCVRTSL